jgi:hypothetical protein
LQDESESKRVGACSVQTFDTAQKSVVQKLIFFILTMKIKCYYPICCQLLRKSKKRKKKLRCLSQWGRFEPEAKDANKVFILHYENIENCMKHER